MKTWMDLVAICKWNKSEKEKHHMISLMWNLKTKTSEQTKQIHRYREPISDHQREEGWDWAKWVKGVKCMMVDGN